MLETNIKPQTGPQPTSTLNQILSDLNQHLHKSLLEELEVLGPELDKTLHDDSHLPDPKHVELAATTVDLLHKVQTKLDPLVLILADHFLGRMCTVHTHSITVANSLQATSDLNVSLRP